MSLYRFILFSGFFVGLIFFVRHTHRKLLLHRLFMVGLLAGGLVFSVYEGGRAEFAAYLGFEQPATFLFFYLFSVLFYLTLTINVRIQKQERKLTEMIQLFSVRTARKPAPQEKPAEDPYGTHR